MVYLFFRVTHVKYPRNTRYMICYIRGTHAGASGVTQIRTQNIFTVHVESIKISIRTSPVVEGTKPI
jgi:hypothetical protein